MTFPSRRRLIRKFSSVFGRAIRKIGFLSGADRVNTPDLPPQTRGNQVRAEELIRDDGPPRQCACNSEKQSSPKRIEKQRDVVREAYAEEDEELSEIEEGRHHKK